MTTLAESLQEWARRWNIPNEALRELGKSVIYTSPTDGDGSESRQQSLVRLEAAKRGNVYLFRNNVGAGMLESGSFVRWGLANDSPKMNEVVKSGDLIGWRSKLIGQSDVGSIIAQFVSREVKHESWKWHGTVEEQAQLKWAAVVNTHGGDAAIVTGPGSL